MCEIGSGRIACKLKICSVRKGLLHDLAAVLISIHLPALRATNGRPYKIL